MDKRIDPNLDKTVYQTAIGYMGTLGAIGYCLMALVGCVSDRITSELAMLIAFVAFVVAFCFGKKYRQRVDEFLERASLITLMSICAKAWPFWLSMMFLTAVGGGLVSATQFDLWSQFMSLDGIAGLALKLITAQLFPPSL